MISTPLLTYDRGKFFRKFGHVCQLIQVLFAFAVGIRYDELAVANPFIVNTGLKDG